MMPPQEIIVIDGRNYPRNRRLPSSVTTQAEANATPRLDFGAARVETRNGSDYFYFEAMEANASPGVTETVEEWRARTNRS